MIWVIFGLHLLYFGLYDILHELVRMLLSVGWCSLWFIELVFRTFGIPWGCYRGGGWLIFRLNGGIGLGDTLQRSGTPFIPLCLIMERENFYKQINWSTLLFDWSQSIQNHFFFVYNFFVILLRYRVLIIMMSMT